MSTEYTLVDNKLIKKEKSNLLYHGSNQIVKVPDLKHSRDNIDFNIGFYLTDSLYQARKWACRPVKNSNTSITNAYNYDFSGLNIKHFELDEEWLDYIIANRTRQPVKESYSEYDILIGPVADDKLFDTIDLYQNGLISTKDAITLMNCMEYNEQTVLKTEKALKHIQFQSYKELKGAKKENYLKAFNNDTLMASQKAGEILRNINQGKRK